MEYGLFTMPSHPPERKLYDGHQWDLQQLRWADELGFSEAWIGEHHTAPWEPHPSPDLLVAQALTQTKQMRIGPGGFLMPFHHPAELANRVAMLDHLAQGRLNFGVAASGLPSDWSMFNVDGMSGQNREMTRESLDIILRLWSDEPEFDYKGKYWHVTKAGTMFGTLRPHIKPFQQPHPPIGVAGLSKGSDTLKLAGERGFWPLSLNLNPAYVGTHWEAVEQGAARSGRTPKRSDWRMVREVFIADTDAEAMRLSAGGHDGADDARVLPPAPRRLRVPRIPETLTRRAGFRRDAGVLRQAQLARRLAQDGGREAPRHLRGRRRLRHAARCSASTTPTIPRPGTTPWSFSPRRSCPSSNPSSPSSARPRRVARRTRVAHGTRVGPRRVRPRRRGWEGAPSLEHAESPPSVAAPASHEMGPRRLRQRPEDTVPGRAPPPTPTAPRAQHPEPRSQCKIHRASSSAIGQFRRRPRTVGWGWGRGCGPRDRVFCGKSKSRT